MLSEIHTYSQQVSRTEAVTCLQLLLDRCYPTGKLRRSRWLDHVEDALVEILMGSGLAPCENFVGQKIPGHRPEPENLEQAIVVDARPYPIEGQESLARELIGLHKIGWKKENQRNENELRHKRSGATAHTHQALPQSYRVRSLQKEILDDKLCKNLETLKRD